MDQGEWLVAFDTDQIKRYLLATTKLKEIRGASALLDDLNLERTSQEARRVCPTAETVYTGGGGALFIAPSKAEAEGIRSAVERLYREVTVSATTTGAVLPLAPATRGHSFGARVQDLGFVLRRNKDQKAWMPDAPVAAYEHVCDACGTLAARVVSTSAGGEQLICESCQRKRDRVVVSARGGVPIPEDFEALGELSSPPGYMGFIYADGNSIGQRLSGLGDADSYGVFAGGLRALLKDALDAALTPVPVRRGVSPAIDLLLGGDDLMLVVAADQALDVAVRLARTFEQRSSGLLAQAGLSPDPPLTLGVGVVLAHVSFPVGELQRIAEECVREAKRRCAENGYSTGAVDYRVLTASAARMGDESPFTNLRPYLVDDLDLLLRDVRALRDYPASQLQAMYESLFTTRENATFVCMLALARARANCQPLRAFLKRTGSMTDDCLPPWVEPMPSKRTALADLVEIMPFVPERG